MSTFHRSWLTGWCIFVALFGLVLAGAAFPATDGPVSLLFALQQNPVDGEMTRHFRFSTALTGALTMGWALSQYALFQAAHRLGDAGTPIWRMALWAVLVWYVVDSGVSIALGFGLNAVSNTLLVVALLVPLLGSGVLKDRS